MFSKVILLNVKQPLSIMRNQNTLGITVIQSDSGGLVEDTKALGIMMLKELGKITR